jgi:hypothetical protein
LFRELLFEFRFKGSYLADDGIHGLCHAHSGALSYVAWQG